jgi:hypothetical protein
VSTATAAAHVCGSPGVVAVLRGDASLVTSSPGSGSSVLPSRGAGVGSRERHVAFGEVDSRDAAGMRPSSILAAAIAHR